MSRPAKWVAPVCIVLAGWTSGAAAAEKAALKPPFEEIGIDQKVGEQVPLDLILKDETGNPVRLGDLFRGKPVVLSLAYYRCPML
ncbi:MAG TPA: SCO family protein, partial [Candidatus Polarisedimenticolia bacterium]|nr:SCO family protein [Candidatus Polarisedimenticolia bacterium]